LSQKYPLANPAGGKAKFYFSRLFFLF